MAAHRVRDLTVAIALEGDFAASYVEGDNSRRRRDRHDEEHGLRARGRAPDGRDRGLRRGPRPALPRAIRRSRAVDGLDRGARLAADRDRRPTRSPATGSSTRTASSPSARDGADGRRRDRRPGRDEDARSRRSRASRATEYTTLAETEDRLLATKVVGGVALRRRRLGRLRRLVRGGVARRCSTSSPSTIQRVGPGVDLDHRPGDPRAASRGRRDLDVAAEPPSLDWSTSSPFGIDERPPGLRLDDRAARADPGDRPAVLSAEIRRLVLMRVAGIFAGHGSPDSS